MPEASKGSLSGRQRGRLLAKSSRRAKNHGKTRLAWNQRMQHRSRCEVYQGRQWGETPESGSRSVNMNMRWENAKNKSNTRQSYTRQGWSSKRSFRRRKHTTSPKQKANRLQSASPPWGSKQGSRSWSFWGLTVHAWTGRGSGGSSKKRSIKPS